MEKISKILDVLKSGNTFLLTTHANADGDAIGSILGLGTSLELLGKEVFYFVPEPVPTQFSFLANFQKINKNIDKIDEVDAILVLDAPHIGRIEGFNVKRVRHKHIIRIDHHRGENDIDEYSYVKHHIHQQPV